MKIIFEKEYQTMFWQILLSILYLGDFGDAFLDFSPFSDILQTLLKWLYNHDIFCYHYYLSSRPTRKIKKLFLYVNGSTDCFKIVFNVKAKKHCGQNHSARLPMLDFEIFFIKEAVICE